MGTNRLEIDVVAEKSGDAPRKKPGPIPRPSGRGINVRLDADLVTKLRYIAAARGENVAALASKMLRADVDAAFRALAPKDERGK